MSVFLNAVRLHPFSTRGIIGIILIYFMSFISIPFLALIANISENIIIEDTWYYFVVFIIYVINIVQLITFIYVIIESNDIMSLQQVIRHYYFATTTLVLLVIINICNIWMTTISRVITLENKILATMLLIFVPITYILALISNIISSRSFIAQIEYVIISLSMYVSCNIWYVMEINYINSIMIAFPLLLFLQLYNPQGQDRLFIDNHMPLQLFKDKYSDIFKKYDIDLDQVSDAYKNYTGQYPIYINHDYVMTLRMFQMGYMINTYGFNCIFQNQEKIIDAEDLVNFDYLENINI